MGFRVGRLSCAATRIPEEWLSTTEPGLQADSFSCASRNINGVEATPTLSDKTRIKTKITALTLSLCALIKKTI
jgi:hypothetical protein